MKRNDLIQNSNDVNKSASMRSSYGNIDKYSMTILLDGYIEMNNTTTTTSTGRARLELN